MSEPYAIRGEDYLDECPGCYHPTMDVVQCPVDGDSFCRDCHAACAVCAEARAERLSGSERCPPDLAALMAEEAEEADNGPQTA